MIAGKALENNHGMLIRRQLNIALEKMIGR